MSSKEQYSAQYKFIKAHKERYAAYKNKYYHANKEKYAASSKKWREANIEYRREKQKKDKRERKLLAIAYLGGKCSRCFGEFHPSIYEFHHRIPEEKDRDPSKMLQLSMQKLLSELDKCDLLCANCHRFTHHGANY